MLEIESLLEIYDKKIFSYKLNKESGDLTGEFIAHNKLVENKSILLIENNLQFQINHLPPIYLKFKFNINNEQPMEISLSSIWLPRRFLRDLEYKLSKIINENSENQLWLCFEFLENESIKILANCDKVDDNLIEININDIFPLEIESKISEIVKMLKQFNDDRDESLFKDLITECCVCITVKRGDECAKFSLCSHIVCNQCLVDHFNTQINLGVLNLSCAVCEIEIDYEEVRRVMDAQCFERWDTLSFTNCVKSMADQRACSRCQKFIAINIDDGYGFCKSCRHTFCLDCNETFNGPKCCHNKTEEEESLNNQRIINRIFHSKTSRSNYNKKVNDVLKGYKLELKYCPKCNLPFEKNGGCNHMNCPSCGTHFCYLCRAILNSQEPYSHFSNKCKLFQVSK